MLFALSSYATAVVATLLLQSAAAQTSKPEEKSVPLCSVSGRVVSAVEGSPLKSARLVLMPEHRDESRDAQVYAASSDSDGRFILKDVPAGRYNFFVARTGYVDQRYKADGASRGAVLALQSGQRVEDVLFRMVLAAVITGRINDEDGEPMANMQVVALQRPEEDEAEDNPWMRKGELTPVGAAQTDDRGQFRIFGLKPAEYYVRSIDEFMPPNIAAPVGENWIARESLGSQYAPVYYPGVTQVGQAQAVPVTAGEEAQVDFIMRRAKLVEVSGHVIGVDGKSCTDCYISLDEQESSGYGIGHETDTDGNFKIRGVAPGTYTLFAESQSSLDGQNYHARQKLEVGSDNIDSVTLALGRGTKISGRIASAGTRTVNFERMFLYLASADGDEQPGGWTRPKKDGSFSFVDVPDGSYTLEVSNRDPDWYVKSAGAGAQDILNDGLQVEKGQPGGSIAVVISNVGAQLDGSVTQDDKPQPAVRVRLTPEPETAYNRDRVKITNTDQSGRFSFTGIAPGRYRVVAKMVSGEGVKPAVSNPREVNLAERDHKTMELAIIPPQ
ncbi:MAG TPA: carboxypeptidase regulatory-like domain-containing protein [Terriglobales bacterium]|nr:carboxypeptidase regulatory-like domain-containing protein [Terriglobales bacterium]